MTKKLRQIFIYLLTGGASLYLGLLSLGGMYALIPLVPVAVLSFILSVAYEGEIYLQNLTQAVKKIFKADSLERSLSRAYLKFLFDANPNILKSERDSNTPSFFYDYMELVVKAQHDRKYKKRLKDLEKMFAELIWGDEGSEKKTPYQVDLMKWLNEREENQKPDYWRKVRSTQGILWKSLALPLSILAGIFSALGTTYLLFETISIVPALAAISLNVWGGILIPLAILAGVSYALLTYNCTTDFLLNNPFSKWFDKIKRIWNEGQYIKAGLTAVAFTCLCTLAGALTICTAGTWVTIVDENSSIYEFISRFPKWVMGIVNPIVTTLSSLAFNLQNTSSSLGILMNLFSQIGKAIQDGISEIHSVWKRESWLQFINPFRLIYQFLFQPLRVILFLGHLASIGVTADRVPGLSKLFSALLGFVAELGEDTHYFFGHDHGSCEGHSIEAALEEHLEGDGHNHNLDLPTRFLTFCVSPLALMSYGWKACANWLIAQPLSLDTSTSCCHNHHHHEPHEDHQEQSFLKPSAEASHGTEEPNTKVDAVQNPLPNNWESNHPLWFLDNYRKRHPNMAAQTRTICNQLHEEITTAAAKPQSSEGWRLFLNTKLKEVEEKATEGQISQGFIKQLAARFSM